MFRECSSFPWLPPPQLGYRLPGNPPFLTRLDAQVNKTAQVLDLSVNEVGDKGTIALAEALKVSFCLFPRMFLVFLVTCLPGNPSFLTRLDAQVNKTVQVLNLRSNWVGNKGTIALADALKVSFVLFRECSPFPWLPPSR